MQFLENEIAHYTEMVWDTSLSLTVSKTDTEALQAETLAPRCAIQITGKWNGWLVLVLSKELTRMATNSFFGPGSAEDPELLEDTLKELANQIGGNLKNLFPSPTQLNIPVASLNGTQLEFPETEIRTQLKFNIQGQLLETLLLENQSAELAQ